MSLQVDGEASLVGWIIDHLMPRRWRVLAQRRRVLIFWLAILLPAGFIAARALAICTSPSP